MDILGERSKKNKHCRVNPAKQQNEPVIAKDEMKVNKAKKNHEHVKQIGLGTLPLTTTVCVADSVQFVESL